MSILRSLRFREIVDEGKDFESKSVMSVAFRRVQVVLFHGLVDFLKRQEGKQFEKLFNLVIRPSHKVSIQVKGVGHERV